MGRISLKLATIVGALIVIESSAQYFLQKYTDAKTKDLLLLGLGFVLYGLLGIVYQQMLASGETLVLANIIWQGATVVVMGAIGYFVFGQKLTTRELIAVIGIIFLMALMN